MSSFSASQQLFLFICCEKDYLWYILWIERILYLNFDKDSIHSVILDLSKLKIILSFGETLIC
jgi:hypothetical protein